MREVDELRQRVDELAKRVGRTEIAWQLWTPQLMAWQEIDWKRRDEIAATISHTVVVVVLIASATIITVLHGDATPVWAALAGYVGGGIVQKASHKTAG